MPAVICLLRGVNVGGNNKLKMEALRTLFESLQLRNPQTYIQSGNVVFMAVDKDLETLARRIESAIEKTFGFRPDTILRTVADMRKVIASNPFGARPEVEPNKLVVMFLDRAADSAKMKVSKQAAEEFHLAGKELFIYYPDGQGKTKLSITPLDEESKPIPFTGRNWNSVIKLLAMAETLED